LADAALLFEWRNDALTRAMSASMAELAWCDHIAWLERSLADPDRQIFIAELMAHNAPVGTARIDRGPQLDELSWTVAPEMRGLGFGRVMIRALMAALGERLAVARIKPINVASWRMALGCGFVRVGASEGLDLWVRDLRTPQIRALPVETPTAGAELVGAL
jgi:RimJ/RimL family protein N-acetyltransferase